MDKICIYDTTLRDGTQAEDVNLSTQDKLRITHKLDELGIHYIEGGWPLSNPTDQKFFEEIRNYHLKNSRITAFGSTHAPNGKPESDPNLQALIQAQTDTITIFGKTWDVHVKEALRTSNENNLDMIAQSVAYLKENVQEVFFDAEHLFDGFKDNPEFALACLKRAHQAGADVLVLCDTNGGTLTSEIAHIIEEIKKDLPDVRLGIHAHNDSELAVANSLIAVEHGIEHVQGTINGYGERCGNANLCSIIPALQLKMDKKTITKEQMTMLTPTSHFISEVCNLRSFHRQPYTGKSAFAHKGGIHVSAVRKSSRTYEHIRPEVVGNKQRILLSDLAGQSNILFKARQYGFHLDKDDPFVLDLLSKLKDLESKGYEYAAADASFELLLNRTLGRCRHYFTLQGFRVLETEREHDEAPISEATVMVKVGGILEHTAASGKGPVNALDNALRKALERFYPSLSEMHLLDFKVRVFTAEDHEYSGTASRVRVLIESGDYKNKWITVGVSFNIIEASKQALEDSLNYKLFKEDQEKLTRAIKEASV